MKNSYLYLLISLSLFFITSCDNDEQASGGVEPIKPESSLTQVSVNTNGNVIVDEPKVNANMIISEENEVAFEGPIAIEFRGASSQALFPKKSYGFETRDSNNEDLDVSLLNFPEEEDWILYAPYSDKSLMRNKVIYDLSRDMNMYASRTKFVELTVNNDYRGVYVFMEKLKRDSQRININKLREDENTGDDVTGGYILKIDKLSGSNLGDGYNSLNSFTSNYVPLNTSSEKRIHFLYEYPDAEDITSQQKDYISSYVNNFENALASDDFKDPVLGYQAYIDIDSFIDFFLLNELSNNVDGYRLSTYMHKDRNGKLKMGPIWDFNLAFGNANYCEGGETNVWAYKFNERCPDDFWLVPFWWKRLLEDESFVARLKQRWSVLRGSIFQEGNIMGKIDDNMNSLNDAGAIQHNFSTWNILGTWIWPNKFVGNNYGEEVGYLKSWISNRLSWLDSEIEKL